MTRQRLLSLDSVRRLASRKMVRLVKPAYQRLISEDAKRLVLVVGCQRSGTTMLMLGFEKDLRTRSYGEFGLSGEVKHSAGNLRYPDADRARLKPYDEIKGVIARERAPLLVVKPLIESQHTASLLDYFPEARAIWMYRDYRDVASSHLVKWGDGVGIRKMRPIFDGDTDNHWVSEQVSESTRRIVKRYFSDDMPPADAVALLWYVRNILFFELALDKSPRVLLCRYEDIVTEPSSVMRNIYHFLGCGYPGPRITGHMHSRSVGRSRHLRMSEGVEEICAKLLQEMNAVNASRSALHYGEAG